MTRRVAGSWALLALALGLSASAQNHPNISRGFGVNKAFELASDLEAIDTFNGGLALRIPIGQSYPLGAGLTYGLTLSYSSKLWDHELVFDADPNVQTKVPQLSPGAAFNAGLGWTLSMGRMVKPDSPGNPSKNWIYVDPDGSYITMTNRLHAEGELQEHYRFSEARGPLRLYAPDENAPTTLEFPDGTVHKFTAQGWPFRIQDPHGNHLDIVYSTSTWTISDQHGRETVVTFSGGSTSPDGVVTQVRVPAFGGQTAFYGFSYAVVPISAACPNQIEPFSHSVPVLTEIHLPDGSSYTMPAATSYFLPYQPSLRCVKHSGLLEGLNLPTRGRLEYDWADWEFPSGTDGDCVEHLNFTPGVIERRRMKVVEPSGAYALDGRWTYAQELHFDGTPGTPTVNQCYGDGIVPPKRATVTVIDPLNQKTVTHFSVAFKDSGVHQAEEYGLPVNRTSPSGGRYLSREIFKAGAQAPVRSIYATYTHFADAKSGVDASLWARPLSGQRTVFHDDGNRYIDVASSSWDGLGHWRTVAVTSNFGPPRTTFTHYNAGSGPNTTPLPTAPWVLGRFSERTVSQTVGSITQIARETFHFVPASGLLQRRRAHAGTGWAAKDLLEVFDYDGAGNLTSERSYGGDKQAISASQSLATLPLPAEPVYSETHAYAYGALQRSEYSGLSFRTVDRDIDSNTGLSAVERDTSGLATSSDYDRLGRTIGVSAPGETPITITYFAGKHPVVTPNGQITSSGSSPYIAITRGSLTKSNVFFDDFGRVHNEDNRMPARDGGGGNYITRRRTRYDAGGNVLQTSTWTEQGNPEEPVKWTRRRQLDPFGRPGKILAPDGRETLFKYKGIREIEREVSIGTGHLAVDPSAWHSGALEVTQVKTYELYDAHGRLTEVRDRTGTNGDEASTLYAYDVGNRLETVTQGGQTRSFQYDQRGFLNWEEHPELGENGRVSYAAYDARGHAGRKYDGRIDLTYTYDAAERLSRIRETGGGQRELKRFDYAGQSTGGDWRGGKLLDAVRVNWVVDPDAPPGPEIPVEIREHYEYKTSSGRVSKRTTSTSLPGMPSFAVTYGYTSLGDVANVTYPRCFGGTAGDCTAGPYRNVTFEYQQGLLSSMPAYLNRLTYHSNGMVNQVQHSHGETDTQDRDPHGMRRPARIYNTIISENLGGGIPSAGPTWTQNGLGPYEYDGVGNITRIGCGSNFYCRQYHYDKGGRLIEEWSPDKEQDYEYDRWGNLTSIDTRQGTAVTPRMMNPDPETNRLGSTVYDASGNQLHWGSTSYGWDAFNNLKTFDNSENHRTFLYTADDERFWTSDYDGTDHWSFTLRGLDQKVLSIHEMTRGEFGSWRLRKDYLYRGGLLLAAVDYRVGRRAHFTLDHLGTPRLATFTNGDNWELFSYFAYGEPDAPPPTSVPGPGDPDPERMQFTGHERDLNANPGYGDDLDYMHARYCNPNLGRFLSLDPAVLRKAQVESQKWNRYSYVTNNPMRYVDPDGRERAQILIDIDNRQLLAGEITAEEFMARQNARGFGALVGLGLLGGGGAAAARLPQIVGFLIRPETVMTTSAVAAIMADQASPATTFVKASALLKPGGRLVGNPGRRSAIRFLGGGVSGAKALFSSLARGGKILSEGSDHLTVVVQGLGKITFRTRSSTAGVEATLELSIKGIGIEKIKFIP